MGSSTPFNPHWPGADPVFSAPVSTTPGGGSSSGQLTPEVKALLDEAQSAYQQSLKDLKAGNLGAYQSDINTLESDLQQVQQLTGTTTPRARVRLRRRRPVDGHGLAHPVDYVDHGAGVELAGHRTTGRPGADPARRADSGRCACETSADRRRPVK